MSSDPQIDIGSAGSAYACTNTESNSVADNDHAIDVRQLSKIYHLYKQPLDRLKQIIWGGGRQYFDEFTALKDVSFTLPKGEVLGLVGRNGAGKSTLLQLICGTLTPTSGELLINGRIAALLELGAGFNPEFTGRENIYLAASVMGVTRREVDQKLDDIIDFSGIRSFIDQPVSTYSSGMYVRLAFSVATSVEPEILVIDEALSVGDGDFARKSFERIMAMRDAGATILFCSHSLYQIEVLCTQAIWLDGGQIQASGSPGEVVPAYQAFLDRLASDDDKAEKRLSSPQILESSELSTEKKPIGNPAQTDNEEMPAESSCVEGGGGNSEEKDTSLSVGSGARLTSVRVVGDAIEEQLQQQGHAQQGRSLHLQSGDKLQLAIEFQTSLNMEEGIPQVALAIHNAGGQLVTSCGSWAEGVDPVIDDKGVGRISITYEKLPLLKGTYYVGVLLFCPKGIFLHDEVDPAVTLHIRQPGKERGLVYFDHTWQGGSVQSESDLNRWQAVDAAEVAQSALLSLFEEAFGHPMSADLWRWKYRYAHSPGSVVIDRETGLPVAFNGAIPREGMVFGQPEPLIQMGDVMSAKPVRGILTRKGPFFQAVEHYLTQNVGPGMRHSIAFGFPHDRACRVGIRRGLYCDIDKIVELNWVCPENTGDNKQEFLSRYKITKITQASFENYQGKIDTQWLQMRTQLTDAAVGCRNSQWIRHRYLDKPGADYDLYWISEKNGAGVSDGSGFKDKEGLLVGRVLCSIDENQKECKTLEILDVVASKAFIPSLVGAAQAIGKSQNVDRIFAWATPKAQRWFEPSKPKVVPTTVMIPGNALALEHSLKVKEAWWLLGGDTDFR